MDARREIAEGNLMAPHPNGPPNGGWDRNGRGEWIQVNRARYNRKSIDELVTTITSMVAEVMGVDPLNYQVLPPMYESVNMESLENLCFEPELFHMDRIGDEEVSFLYAGFNIRLGTDGWVTVYEKQ